MSVIHRTTLEPTKLELLTAWLPGQPWYRGTAGVEPQLTRVGGFRLDDPRGEVGIEFMAATDTSGDHPVTYHVPFGYRGAPLDGADNALIGTTEHGVLGKRWVYDGTHDPVVVDRLLALILGEAEPQAQSTSDTPDLSVTGYFAEKGHPASITSTDVTSGPFGTDLLLRTASGSGPGDHPVGHLTVRVNRVLRQQEEAAADAATVLGHVTAEWQLPDGVRARGRYAVVSAFAPDSR